MTMQVLSWNCEGEQLAQLMHFAPVNALEGGPWALEGTQLLEMYDALRPSLFLYIRSLGILPDKAEDVIQEAFLRLLKHLQDHKRADNLHGWVFRVSYRLAMDVHRANSHLTVEPRQDAKGPVREAVDPSPNPEQQYLLSEEYRAYTAALLRLTPQQRKCLALRAEGLAYRQIAERLGISWQRVGELVHRGLERLAEHHQEEKRRGKTVCTVNT